MLKLALLIAIVFAALNLLHLRAEVYFHEFNARSASAVYPWDHRYPFMLGNGNFKVRRYNNAVSNFNRVLALSPYHFQAKNGLGVAYAMLEKKDKAIGSLTEALRLAPTHPRIQQNMRIASGEETGRYTMLLVKN